MLTAPGRTRSRPRVEGGATMRAALLTAFRSPLQVADIPSPAPRGGEVLVRVAAAGVCRLDVELAGGLLPDLRLPAVLGHEVAGWVEAAGPEARGVILGSAVVVHGGWGCGECATCRAGEEQLCARRRW